jgi:septum site-determining protein MinC
MHKTSAAQDAPCEIRVGQVGLTQVRLRSIDPEPIRLELRARVATAPQLFKRTAVCIDLSKLADLPSAGELRAALSAIRDSGFIPVGLLQGAESVDDLADAVDVPVIAHWRAPSKPALGALLKDISPLGKVAAPPAAPAEPPQPMVALVHDLPVRSGQRVYARNRDLVLTNVVGAGAEVMADGCVHIYGALRGRALAGARGDKAARVFCQEFNAELVSIAGVFRVFETIPAELAGAPVQARLKGDDLHFTRIGPA